MGRRDSQDDTGPGTRERIIAQAAEHLARLGPRHVELKAVCADLGVSPSLVNYHFTGPSEVLWEAALFAYETHVVAQGHALEAAADATEAVEQWVLATIEWKRRSPGVAAVIDYPMLALGEAGLETPDAFIKTLSGLSRANVTTLGSAVYALMAGKPPRRLSTARVAALIRINREFAYWISLVGFGGQGAAMWVAGRKPYGFLWKAFGFDPDRQVRATLNELVKRMRATPPEALPGDDEVARAEALGDDF